MSTLLPFRDGHDSDASCFDVSDLLQEVAEHLEVHAVRQGVQIEVDAPPYVMVSASQSRMRQVFRYLLLAAIDGTSAGGDVVVTAYHEEDLIEIEIAEGGADMIDGPQSAADDRQLAIDKQRIEEARRLLAAEGAELELTDCADGGAAYIVQLARAGYTDEGSRKAA